MIGNNKIGVQNIYSTAGTYRQLTGGLGNFIQSTPVEFN
jgi:hypothetical protein